MLNFGNMDTEIPLPNYAARLWEVCVECPKWKEKKEKKVVPKSGESKKKSVTFTIFL